MNATNAANGSASVPSTSTGEGGAVMRPLSESSSDSQPGSEEGKVWESRLARGDALVSHARDRNRATKLIITV